MYICKYKYNWKIYMALGNGDNSIISKYDFLISQVSRKFLPVVLLCFVTAGLPFHLEPSLSLP